MSSESWKSKLGEPSLEVAGLRIWVTGRQFPEATAYDDANWLIVVVNCHAPGASVWVQGAILEASNIAGFARGCEAMMRGESDRAILAPVEPELHVEMRQADQLGHVLASVQITPDNLAQEHQMSFEIDLSYLPEISRQCAALLREYPVRGAPSEENA